MILKWVKRFFMIMTVTQIVDAVLPLTKSDMRCGFEKSRKIKARAELILLINDYLEGVAVTLSEQIKKMLVEQS